MRFAGIITALLIMILPRSTGMAVAADPVSSVLYASHPALMRIEAPILITLGCVLLALAGLGRVVLRNQ